jgi:hypothetical protein
MRHALTLIAIASMSIAAGSCHKNDPGFRPVNRFPVMTSLSVFPSDIAISDSAVVTCLATDQDGDTLVYDWATDLRLRIRGNRSGDPTKSNTFSNSETFYPDYHPAQVDTVRIACSVRDRRGGVATGAIRFTVHP